MESQQYSFHPHKGSSKGEPLSQVLFILMAAAFCRTIHKQHTLGNWIGVKIESIETSVTHYFFIRLPSYKVPPCGSNNTIPNGYYVLNKTSPTKDTGYSQKEVAFYFSNVELEIVVVISNMHIDPLLSHRHHNQ